MMPDAALEKALAPLRGQTRETILDGLSDEQRRVAEIFGRGMAVTAGAGSGKTTTLVRKCTLFVYEALQGPNQNRDSAAQRSARFAAVSFTERSTSDLKLRLTERLGSLDASGHWVMTIHGLCGSILREFSKEAGFDGGERVLSEAEARVLWERACERLWRDDLPETVGTALERLLARESQSSLFSVIARVRTLEGFGAVTSLERSTDPDAQALLTVARFVVEAYRRAKRRRGVVDFDDLESAADRALEHEAVRDAYQKRFGLVLVDEFQDTNAVQARILRRFCRPDLSNLCVVGDPKQSIYRFRDADVTVFDAFCHELPERISLTRNYRSRPEILDYVNRVCAPAFEASALEYEALVPAREGTPRESPPAVVRLDVTQPAELAQWILKQRADGHALDEMALLVRRIRGNEKWFKTLTALGVPIAIGSGGLFWDDPRVHELVAFLRWWDQPEQRLSGAVFLRAPWMQIPDATLDAWQAQDPTWQKPFFASDHPVARSLARFRTETLSASDLLLKLWELSGSETSGPLAVALEDELGAALLGLWHRLEDLSLRGLGFRAVVREISRAIERAQKERDVPPPRNSGVLTVLTIHGSKGLEFPTVILIDLGKKGKDPDMPLLYWDRERGASLGVRTEEGQRDSKAEKDWRLLEKHKNVAESKRVFYVALTRAEDRLILVCTPLPEPKVNAKAGAEPENPADAYLKDHWRAWIDAGPACEREEVKAMRGAPAESSHPSPLTRPKSVIALASPRARVVRPRHSVTEWVKLSQCERWYEWQSIRPRHTAVRPEMRPETRPTRGQESSVLGKFAPGSNDFGEWGDDTLPTRELGTEVHACLAERDWERLRQLEQRVGASRVNAAAIESWARKSPLMAPEQEAFAELAFDWPVAITVEGAAAHEIVVGSIDRLIVDRASRILHVVDFKVTESRKSPAELIAAYETQLRLYAEAARRMIGAESDFQVHATLVAIHRDHIVEIPVFDHLESGVFATELAQRAAEIVNGRAGEPRPGAQCRVCEFRADCDVGRTQS